VERCFVRAAAAVDAPELDAPALAPAASMGPDLWNRTYYPTGADANSLIKPWYLVDAEGQTLGRLATMVAMHIRYAPGLSTLRHGAPSPAVQRGAGGVPQLADAALVTARKARRWPLGYNTAGWSCLLYL
jgi:hypothetical protein